MKKNQKVEYLMKNAEFFSSTKTAKSAKKQKVSNLFVTSKNETMNSPIHEFKVLHEGQRAF